MFYAIKNHANPSALYFLSFHPPKTPLPRDFALYNPLHIALQYKNLPMTLHLLQHYPKLCRDKTIKKQTMLHIACESGFQEGIEVLLRQYYRTSSSSSSSSSYCSIRTNKSSSSSSSLLSPDASSIPFNTPLINAYVNVNEMDIDGNTALHLASSFNHYAICSLLISACGTIHQKNNAGWTPLDYAFTNELKTYLRGCYNAMMNNTPFPPLPSSYQTDTSSLPVSARSSSSSSLSLSSSSSSPSPSSSVSVPGSSNTSNPRKSSISSASSSSNSIRRVSVSSTISLTSSSCSSPPLPPIPLFSSLASCSTLPPSLTSAHLSIPSSTRKLTHSSSTPVIYSSTSSNTSSSNNGQETSTISMGKGGLMTREKRSKSLGHTSNSNPFNLSQYTSNLSKRKSKLPNSSTSITSSSYSSSFSSSSPPPLLVMSTTNGREYKGRDSISSNGIGLVEWEGDLYHIGHHYSHNGFYNSGTAAVSPNTNGLSYSSSQYQYHHYPHHLSGVGHGGGGILIGNTTSGDGFTSLAISNPSKLDLRSLF